MKVIEKPVEYEARQYTKDNVDEFIKWLEDDIVRGWSEVTRNRRDELLFKNQDGQTRRLYLDDWVVVRDGHLFACYADAEFREKYSEPQPQTIQFTQNNYSPPLSQMEIHRQSKKLLENSTKTQITDLLMNGVNTIAPDTPQEKARRLVATYYNEHAEITDDYQLGFDDTFIVWFGYILGNWKALVSTTVSDGMYYEVTHNSTQAETYVDAYKKWKNVCYPD